ncbi:MAG: hypothetical protein GTO02_07180 [Candidatus Dadabacteria bacterium]|nr:hypothetical protein [Candidatus Dadabacteria bacterium]NIQ14178.1 hypothetical protein [Candidatus Dadabacteria bacterium]
MRALKVVFALIFVFCLSCTNNEDTVTDTEEETNVEIDTQEKTSEKLDSEEKDEDAGIDLDASDSPAIKNRPPKMRSIRIVTLTSNPRDGFQAIATAIDPEGDPVNFIYQWKYNKEDIVGATEDSLEWREEFVKGGELSIEVIPYDDEAQGIWKSEGSFDIPNSPPIIDSEPPTSVTDGKFKYNYNAYDPDGDEIKFSLNNAPEGMILNTSLKVIEWIFTEKNKGTYNVEFLVSDMDGASTSQLLDITVVTTNN